MDLIKKVIYIKNKHDYFIFYTTHLIYTAIRFKGQCGMFALFNNEKISDDIINWSYRNRERYCFSPEEINLNKEICERLLTLTMEERSECCQTARKRILIDAPFEVDN